MDNYNVFLLLKGTGLSILVDSTEDTTIRVFKESIGMALDRSPGDLRLYYNGQLLDESNTMSFYNLTTTTAMLHSPATLILVQKMDSGDFEKWETILNNSASQQHQNSPK